MPQSSLVKLLLLKASQLVIPDGGGVEDGIRFLTDRPHREKILAEAKKVVDDSIAAVKSALDNPYKTDEEIATAILARFNERKR